jgi:hypothetical protein
MTYRYHFGLVNNTCYKLTVNNVKFDAAWDYKSIPDELTPRQMIGWTLTPHDSKRCALEILNRAKGAKMTLSIQTEDRTSIELTADPEGVFEPAITSKPSLFTPRVSVAKPTNSQWGVTNSHGNLEFVVSQQIPSLSDWMRELAPIRGGEPLSTLLLPGTHDSGSYRGILSARWANTQEWTIKQQLENGIRVFDIRVALNRDESYGTAQESLEISHGPVGMGFFYSDVIGDFHAFLDAHPGECIVMICKQEYTEHNDFGIRIEDENTRLGARIYKRDDLPTIDKAKGKIVLLRRYPGTYGISVEDWPDDKQKVYEKWLKNKAFYVQDYFENISLENKKQHIVTAFGARGPSGWLLNFASVSAGFTESVSSWAKDINTWLASYLVSNHILSGTLMMDYPTSSNVERLICTNFRP